MPPIARLIRSASIAAALMIVSPASAKVVEVKMLNRGETGTMVYEPDYVELEPGDKIKFIAGHKTHNAASMPEIIPEGATPFKGQINEEVEVTFDVPGFYGVKCSPHYTMGMAMLVKVGEAELTEEIRNAKIPPLVKKRFDATFAKIDGQ